MAAVGLPEYNLKRVLGLRQHVAELFSRNVEMSVLARQGCKQFRRRQRVFLQTFAFKPAVRNALLLKARAPKFVVWHARNGLSQAPPLVVNICHQIN